MTPAKMARYSPTTRRRILHARCREITPDAIRLLPGAPKIRPHPDRHVVPGLSLTLSRDYTMLQENALRTFWDAVFREGRSS